jgi:EpsI family protein
MRPIGTGVRLIVLSTCLIGAAALARLTSAPVDVAVASDFLQTMPSTLGDWRGHDARPLTPDVVAQLGADSYLNRIYVLAEFPVSLYVGYYGSQREGDSIHSPQNCLPGAGWLPVTTSALTLAVEGRAEAITVNRLLVQKGLDRQVVLYWYQSQGRVVASDYWSKAYLVYDALRYNRSDAAIVRIVSPVLAGEADTDAAEARATVFLRLAFPEVSRLLPV